MTDFHPTGIKAQGERELSPRERMRLEEQLQIVRNRFERWMRVKYRILLKKVKRELLDLGVPTEEQITEIEMRFEEEQRKLFIRFYESIYPEFASFIMDDDLAKGFTPRKMEIKARLNLGILAWIYETVGTHIKVINGYVPPLDEVRHLMVQSESDPVVFKRLMDDSQMWSTTGMEVRSRRIAVTETTVAMNDSMAKTSERLAMGRKRVKTWYTSGGRNVRDSHKKLDGKTIPAEDYFEVDVYEWVKGVGLVNTGLKDKMLRPGDHSLAPHASNVVNCHCWCVFRYVD